MKFASVKNFLPPRGTAKFLPTLCFWLITTVFPVVAQNINLNKNTSNFIIINEFENSDDIKSCHTPYKQSMEIAEKAAHDGKSGLLIRQNESSSSAGSSRIEIIPSPNINFKNCRTVEFWARIDGVAYTNGAFAIKSDTASTKLYKFRFKNKWTKYEFDISEYSGILNGKLSLLIYFSPLKDKKPFDLYIDGVQAKLNMVGFSQTKKKGVSDERINKSVETRKVFDRTYVFPRSQVKYDLHADYTKWIDRPLQHDRSLGSAGESYVYESVEKKIKDTISYGVDGWAILTAPHMLDRYQKVSTINEKAKTNNFSTVPEFYYKGGLNYKRAVLKHALSLKSSFRINNKLVVTSYMADRIEPELLLEELATLRKEFGDTFIFISYISKFWYGANKEFIENNNKLTDKTKEKIKKHLRVYAEITDGLMFGKPHHIRTRDRKCNYKFYREAVIPLYRDILSESQFKSKYLVLSSAVGYMNHVSGSTCSADGTKGLRYTFEAALEAKPDMIILPEYDEFNENTCIMPTVARSFSSQRILKYYMHKIKDEVPSPNVGDDISIPNMIISYRRALQLGEIMDIELLNVPDSDKNETYEATLILKDIKGNVVKKFPAEKFAVNQLQDKTYYLPSEIFAKYKIIMPEISLVNTKGEKIVVGDGLFPMMLNPSLTRDYLHVNQPLRDIMKPDRIYFKSESVKLDKTANRNLVTLKGGIKCNENIAFLEVIEDGKEIYAYDIKREYGNYYDNENYIFVRILFRTMMKRKYLSGAISVRNSDFHFYYPYTKFINYQRGEKVIRLDKLYISEAAYWPSSYLSFVIPRKNVDRAVIEFELNELKTSVPVKIIDEENMYSEVFADGLSIIVSRINDVPNHPFHINEKEADFEISVFPKSDNSIFYMRAITKSGKIFRTLPIMPLQREEEIAINVFSDTKNEVVNVKTQKQFIPDLEYEFNPKHGAILYTDKGPEYCGIMGTHGNTSFWPYSFNRPYYPENVIKTAPEWVSEDGETCLKFDGIGNFIVFPFKFFPRGSFTLSFEIKPTSTDSCFLFVHHGYYPGSLKVKMDQGKLKASFMDDNVKKHDFDPNLTIPSGQWSKITIIYDMKNIVFKVNEKTSKPIPFSKKALYATPSAFGGFGRENKFFQGFLKSFSMTHRAVE